MTTPTITPTTCTGHWLTPVEFDRVPGEWNPHVRYHVSLHRCSGCPEVWAIVTDEDYRHRQGSYTLSGGTVADMGGVTETLARFAVANVEATGQL